MTRWQRLALSLLLGPCFMGPLLLGLAVPARALSADAGQVEFFETQVRPLLAKHCFKCHGQEKQKGKLRLDRRAFVFGAEGHDPVVIPGKPGESRIMQVLAYKPLDVQMPPAGKLPKEEIAILAAWIKKGAVWPKSAEPDPGPVADPAKVKFFETKIRPLLANHCFKCHGPKKQKSKLRLDRRAFVLGTEGHDPVVIPGKPGASRILQVLAYKPLDVQMPPAGKLSKEKIALLTAWIKDGAVWPKPAPGSELAAPPEKHWAFQPMSDPLPPAVEHQGRINNPIDSFLLARLEEKGLHYSPPAERAVLLRRVYLDLLGIPPTPAQMREFLADDSPGAYGRVIDELLASPLYGQRWARHWLDVARYADTKGYVFQEDMNYPYSYTYRDYVVRAYNADKPYDRFIVEQLAADLLDLPPKAPELAAMGFLTVGRRNLNNIQDIIDDRIDVTTRGLMALTVACARCHDHKFDPIPTADYYSLYGVFASCVEPSGTKLPLIGEPEQTPAYQKFQAEVEKRKQAVAAYEAELAAAFAKESRTNAAKYLLALVKGAEAFPKARTGFLGQWKACLKRAGEDDPVFALWNRVMAAAVRKEPFDQRLADALVALAGDSAFQSGLGHSVLESLTQESFSTPDELAARYGALFTVTTTPEKDLSTEQKALRKSLEAHLGSLGIPFAFAPQEVHRFRNTAERNKLRGLQKKVDAFVVHAAAAPPRAMVLRDKPHPVHPAIFIRGSSGNRGEKIPRRFLKVLSDGERKPFPDDASGRLQLAHLIASPENPLTARTMVNRIWQHHFGKGIVRTPSNFGKLGKPPTHPKLLDWLAQRFIESGWSIKSMHRLIMTSAAYRQSSVNRATAQPKIAVTDPTNKLLWRMNPRRLEFEAMRDATLAVAGRLDPALGGRPIKLFETKSRRRTIYGYVNRNDMPAVRRYFDFPSSVSTIGGRSVTTVPQQALFAMNSTFTIAQATAVVQREAVVAAQSPREVVGALYHYILQRDPRPAEWKAAVAFLEAPVSAEREKQGIGKRVQLAQVLLMTNEFMFIE